MKICERWYLRPVSKINLLGGIDLKKKKHNVDQYFQLKDKTIENNNFLDPAPKH